MRQQRLNRLLELVSERGSLSVEEIQEALGVSPSTARRDLDELARQRLVMRTHGGATALGSSYELPLRYKVARQAEAKQVIAQAAAALVSPGQTLAMNGGTTTTEVARAIGRRDDLEPQGVTVVTNALNIAYELSIRPNVTIVVTGGIARAQSYELVGQLGEHVIDGVNVDTAIIGVDGISARAGLTTVAPAEATISAKLIGAADRVVVVADATKHDRVTFATMAGLADVDVLVTDAEPAAPLGDALRDAGVEVVVAGS
jgi:DeoR family transcriptional regulator of aga operon